MRSRAGSTNHSPAHHLGSPCTQPACGEDGTASLQRGAKQGKPALPWPPGQPSHAIMLSHHHPFCCSDGEVLAFAPCIPPTSLCTIISPFFLLVRFAGLSCKVHVLEEQTKRVYRLTRRASCGWEKLHPDSGLGMSYTALMTFFPNGQDLFSLRLCLAQTLPSRRAKDGADHSFLTLVLPLGKEAA